MKFIKLFYHDDHAEPAQPTKNCQRKYGMWPDPSDCSKVSYTMFSTHTDGHLLNRGFLVMSSSLEVITCTSHGHHMNMKNMINTDEYDASMLSLLLSPLSSSIAPMEPPSRPPVPRVWCSIRPWASATGLRTCHPPPAPPSRSSASSARRSRSSFWAPTRT